MNGTKVPSWLESSKRRYRKIARVVDFCQAHPGRTFQISDCTLGKWLGANPILANAGLRNLDHTSRKLFRDVLLRLKVAGKILVLVTHEPDLETIADITLRVTPDDTGIRRCVLADPVNVGIHQDPSVLQAHR